MAKAPRNKTLEITEDDERRLEPKLVDIDKLKEMGKIENVIINHDFLKTVQYLPKESVSLLFMDPPYNLTKKYNSTTFNEKSYKNYQQEFRIWFKALLPLLKKDASIYVCSEWKTSSIIFDVLNEMTEVRNRIVWKRDKGRGAKNNWKNNSEDVWFCTVGKEYYFDVESVKEYKQVIAPYRTSKGKAKDWVKSQEGEKFRRTHPSNIWTDLTVPFWSMFENTNHPTQKPEKMLAKIILASSKEDDLVLDPFVGSGTTAVVAKKLGRRFIGIEREKQYCFYALKRLETAVNNKEIQGYVNGMFMPRNYRNSGIRTELPKRQKMIKFKK